MLVICCFSGLFQALELTMT